MPKFRKKPVVIEAVQFRADNRDELETWLEDRDAGHSVRWDSEIRNCSADSPDGYDYPCLRIPTLEGEMTASLGDWIIKGVRGELYPCKPDIFATTYEAVE